MEKSSNTVLKRVRRMLAPTNLDIAYFVLQIVIFLMCLHAHPFSSPAALFSQSHRFPETPPDELSDPNLTLSQ